MINSHQSSPSIQWEIVDNFHFNWTKLDSIADAFIHNYQYTTIFQTLSKVLETFYRWDSPANYHSKMHSQEIPKSIILKTRGNQAKYGALTHHNNHDFISIFSLSILDHQNHIEKIPTLIFRNPLLLQIYPHML